jgi:TonB-linked SusC/RagA family outer membrane protein
MRKILLPLLAMLCTFYAFAQTKNVNGRILDERGEPIAFASVKIKGSRTGVAADASGNFNIRAANGDILVISSAGSADKEVTVTDIPLITVQLSRNQAALTEVVVTGYGTRSKRSSAGSVSAVAIDEIRTQPIASFDQLLQGQATGVNIRTGTGQPGSAAEVVIRGRGSISGSTNPLYIVDGVQINAADFATLNQGDFESVSILKDAAAASIYGSRAAGGVIVVTTRRGRVGPVRFNYDVQYGQSYWPRQKLKLMNTDQKLDYEMDHDNPNGWTQADVDSLRNIHTDWEDVFFRTGITQMHQLSASGGTDRTRFYASLSYMDQTGVVKATGLKRYTGRINLESGTNTLRFGLNTSFGYSIFNNTAENNQSVVSPLNGIRWSLPYFTPYGQDGKYLQDPTPSGQPNPLQELLENKRRFPQWKGVANAFIEYKPTFVKGITLRTNWGFDYTQNESEVYNAPGTNAGAQAQGGQGSLARLFNRNFRYIGTTSINYKNTWGDHDFSGSIYHEILETDFNQFNFTGYGLTLPFPNEASITDGTATNGFIPIVRGTGTDNSLVSYFAEADYAYKNRYFFHAGYRRDGSSRFGANNKWADFYNVGASWIFSDEAFFEPLKSTVDLLKLKASYGTVGNQNGIADFASRALFGKINYAGTTGLGLTSPGNPDLRWETKSTLNLGIEFALLKNRISGSVEFYNSITKDLFYNKTLSQTTGFASVLSNAGRLRNRGIEVNLRGVPVNTRDFSWTIDGNFTYNKNTILELGPDGEDSVLQADGVSILKIGKPINTLYLVRYAGVDPANGDPLYYDKDGKVTSTFSSDNSAFLGTSDAPYFGGITNTFRYKALELQVFWVFVFGNELYNNDRFNVEYPGYIASSLSADLLREWRQPGDITDIPRADPSVYNLDKTSHFVENGSYWRLRNVQLSYTLPKKLLDKMKVNSLRVFAQGQNLYTGTKYRGYDPEPPSNGGTTINAGAQYPTLKTVTVGINLGF